MNQNNLAVSAPVSEQAAQQRFVTVAPTDEAWPPGLDEGAGAAFASAAGEARALGHYYVGPEHLLLALIRAARRILFVLHTGIAWQHLPAELGFGSGVTCWRRQTEHGSGLVHQVDVAWTLQ